MSATPRDYIYTVIHTTDKFKLTIEIVQEQADEPLSRYSIKHGLNGLTETGVLKHKSGSPYWYIT